MANSNDASSAAERIQASGLNLSAFPGGGIVTDPIDMDHLFRWNDQLAIQLVAHRLDVRAKVLQVMGEAMRDAAKLVRDNV